MPGPRYDRRRFLKAAAVGTAAASFVPRKALGMASLPGASERIRLGVIGCGVRGKYLIANLPAAARVVALCDCSRQRIETTRRPQGRFVEPLAHFAEEDAEHVAVHTDYRRMLEQEPLDAVIIATPDHHHALASILAMQAGMDVYCEKPLALTIAEGQAMVQATRRHRRILQVGSQQRTMAANQFACEFVRDGGLGKVSLVEVRNYPGPVSIGSLPEEPIPDYLQWDQFLGPAAARPHHRNLWVKEEFRIGDLLWRGWDLFRDYSGHLVTNWGGHALDMVQYALGMDESGPVGVHLETQLLVPQLAREWSQKTPPPTPYGRTEELFRYCPVTMRYANGIELRWTPGIEPIVIHGERGTMKIWRNRYETDPPDLAPPPDADEQARWSGAGHVARPHLENWLRCLVTREEPNAPVEVGHRSATVCHLANLARQLRRDLEWDPRAERFSDTEANALLSRPRRPGWNWE